MRALETSLAGLVLVEPPVYEDERGFMIVSYAGEEMRSMGIDEEFVQENHSRSRRGTVRGLHYQTYPGQAKLVRCVRGRIWDVAVDFRAGSRTLRELGRDRVSRRGPRHAVQPAASPLASVR